MSTPSSRQAHICASLASTSPSAHSKSFYLSRSHPSAGLWCPCDAHYSQRERATEREAGSESHVSLCLLAATYMVVVLPPTLDSMATANKTSNSSSSECTVIVIILSPGLSLLLSLLPFMFRNRLTTFHSFLLMLNTSKRCLDASSVAPPNPKFSAATSANELQIRPLYTISA